MNALKSSHCATDGVKTPWSNTTVLIIQSGGLIDNKYIEIM